ncbi:MAG: hypothetical protein ACK50Q_17745 [Labrys sp. (in: a-proteobacteria)]
MAASRESYSYRWELATVSLLPLFFLIVWLANPEIWKDPPATVWIFAKEHFSWIVTLGAFFAAAMAYRSSQQQLRLLQRDVAIARRQTVQAELEGMLEQSLRWRSLGFCLEVFIGFVKQDDQKEIKYTEEDFRKALRRIPKIINKMDLDRIIIPIDLQDKIQPTELLALILETVMIEVETIIIRFDSDQTTRAEELPETKRDYTQFLSSIIQIKQASNLLGLWYSRRYDELRRVYLEDDKKITEI